MFKNLRLRLSILILLCFFSFYIILAQGVTIGANKPPNSSSILDLQSNSKGFLPPRLTEAQRKAIASPAAGLVVYDMDINQLFLFDGTQWQSLSGSGSGNSIMPTQQAQPAAEQKAENLLGIDVAIDDSLAVAGASGTDIGAVMRAGAVYVYKKGANGWVQAAKLFASDPQANAAFGASVGIAGDYIVVGAPKFTLAGVASVGKVYVFQKGAGDTWTEQTAFTRAGNAANDNFGFSVAISKASAFGPAIIAGAPNADVGGADKGIATTYRLSGGIWIFQGNLQPSDLATTDNFGWEVDVDGDYCVAGAPNQNYVTNFTTTFNSGAAYIYNYTSGSGWVQQKKIFPNENTSNSTANIQFGFSLSIKGAMVAVGAPSAALSSNTTSGVYVYEKTTSWFLRSTLYLTNNQGFDGTNKFGTSVALHDDNLLVGMPGGKINSNGVPSNTKQGYVVVYKREASGFHSLIKIINDNEPLPPAFNGSFFGNAVAIKNGNCIIGIPGKKINGKPDVGSVAFGYLE